MGFDSFAGHSKGDGIVQIALLATGAVVAHSALLFVYNTVILTLAVNASLTLI